MAVGDAKWRRRRTHSSRFLIRDFATSRRDPDCLHVPAGEVERLKEPWFEFVAVYFPINKDGRA